MAEPFNPGDDALTFIVPGLPFTERTITNNNPKYASLSFDENEIRLAGSPLSVAAI